jgi:hypothetical protein
MLLNALISVNRRVCSHRNVCVDRRWSRHPLSHVSVCVFAWFVVFVTSACSASVPPPSSHVTATSSTTRTRLASTVTATVAPGTVLYQANWSHNFDGWKGSGGWFVVQGNLEGSSEETISLSAPYEPPVSNYAVEARIQIVRVLHKTGGFFSLFAGQVPGKDGYQAGVSGLMGPGPRPNGSNPQLQIYIDPIGDMDPGSFAPNDYDPKTQWHLYRVEVQGNTATFVVDGVSTHTVTSEQTQVLSNGPLGLKCGLAVVRVSDFRILAL